MSNTNILRELQEENKRLRDELAKYKPSWDDAPESATHRAIDYDGEWMYFVGKPLITKYGWMPVEDYGILPVKFSNWKNTLEERP